MPSDSGAYSCEAINNIGRIFAVDAIVRVKPGKIISSKLIQLL
jgi:hypothetical protein